MKKKLIKKSISLIIIAMFVFGLVNPVFAEDNSIKVQLNGQNIAFDVPPKIVKGRTLVPMRIIFEQLGATVDWDGNTNTVTATKEDTVIKLRVNSLDAFVTNKGVQKTIKLDVAPTIMKGRTLVPLRFVSESMGKQVGWDEYAQAVIIIDYDYFLKQLKERASNFYEFSTNKYNMLNSGEINSSANITFKYIDTDNTTLGGNVKVNFNAKLDENNGSFDTVIDIAGLKDILSSTPLENMDKINIDALFDNNSFYIKSNLFSLLEEDGVHMGDKFLKVNVTDLNIPNVKTVQDIRKFQEKSPADGIVNQYATAPDYLWEDSFKQTQYMFNAFVKLVDNDHFTVTNSNGSKIYRWNINKQDIVNMIYDMSKNSGGLGVFDLQQLARIKKLTDSLVFDFNMEAVVTDNVFVSGKVHLNVKVDEPYMGHFELLLDSDGKVTNPNNTHFDIKIPDSKSVVDYMSLVQQGVLPQF